VKDADAANELYQDFALRFVRGDFSSADPAKGRFRHFLKRVLHNLVIDHFRARKRTSKEKPLAPHHAEQLADASRDDADRAFADGWKAELLARVWSALRNWQDRHRQPYYTVLRCRADHPLADSAEMAQRVSQALGKTVTTGWLRNRLHFARAKFAELVVEEVRQTLVDPTREFLEQELIDLGLFERCKGALG
jgi:RNA polymerase sigma-70 factor (ECF subfamily)